MMNHYMYRLMKTRFVSVLLALIVGWSMTYAHVVTWSVDGTETAENYSDGQELALPETPSDCSETRVFVGWTASKTIADGTKPADLFTEAAGAVTADTKYYAVYATPSVETGGEETWRRVTDDTSLQAGEVLVIASEPQGATAATISSAVLGQVISEFKDGKITSLGEGTVTFTLGGKKDEWTLTSSEGKLGATAVKKLAWDDDTAMNTWSITIDSDNNATIQNGTSTYGRILYNVNNPRFTTYTSNTSTSMLLPQLYRKSGGSVTRYSDYTLRCQDVPVVTYTVTWVACGDEFKTEEYAEGDPLVLPNPTPAANDGKAFYGWIAEEDYTGVTAPALIQAGTAVTGDVTYYAIYR